MKRMQAAVSPCGSCTRVKDPANCENKNCGAWRTWFSTRWDLLRSYPRRMMDSVQKSFVEDPCSCCGSPRDLCRTPCRSRREWDKARGVQKE